MRTQSYISGFNKVRGMSKGQKSVRERWRRQEPGKASWRRWHFSWSLEACSGKVQCVPSFDHLLNKYCESPRARQCAGAEDVFMNTTGKFSEAGILVGAANNSQMNV